VTGLSSGRKKGHKKGGAITIGRGLNGSLALMSKSHFARKKRAEFWSRPWLEGGYSLPGERGPIAAQPVLDNPESRGGGGEGIGKTDIGTKHKTPGWTATSTFQKLWTSGKVASSRGPQSGASQAKLLSVEEKVQRPRRKTIIGKDPLPGGDGRGEKNHPHRISEVRKKRLENEKKKTPKTKTQESRKK